MFAPPVYFNDRLLLLDARAPLIDRLIDGTITPFEEAMLDEIIIALDRTEGKLILDEYERIIQETEHVLQELDTIRHYVADISHVYSVTNHTN